MRITIEVEKPPSRRKKVLVEVVTTWKQFIVY